VTALLLKHAPTQSELARLYHELARVGASSVGERKAWPYAPSSLEELIVLASQMLRYDPRLLSILVQWLRSSYGELDPQELRRKLRQTRWPQSLLVALEFAKLGARDPELNALADYVAAGFARVEPAERFFFDTESPGSRAAARNLGRNLAPYARWGFLGQERPIVDPISKRALGRYDIETRRRILKELVERRETFSIADYLSSVDHGISRQQALADLTAYTGIEPIGQGRGARWRRKSSDGK
jgi:hypothetical protein